MPVREKEQPDRGLGDESGLREDESMAHDATRPPPVGDEPEHRGSEADHDDRQPENRVDGYHRAHPTERNALIEE
jgi:hypothetical protein